ncbi:hypothetical protein DSECCO2_569100 [anaerobic digester metagenome]
MDGAALGLVRPDEERTDDGCDDTDRGDEQREDDHVHDIGVRELRGRDGNAEDHRRDDRADVGFVEVRAHAGDVADVVADVVGDDGRIAGVILGDARFDLADQIGTDVCGLGEYTAADTGEEGDRTCPETEPGHRGEDFGLGKACERADNHIRDREPEKPEPDDSHAHDRPARKRDPERIRDPSPRGVRGPDVCSRGGEHADIAGRRRERRAEHETCCGERFYPDRKDDGKHDDE